MSNWTFARAGALATALGRIISAGSNPRSYARFRPACEPLEQRRLLAVCLPGAQFVADCVSGTDTFDARGSIVVDAGLGPQTVALSGTGTIFRGDPLDTNADTIPDTIQAELVNLLLTGTLNGSTVTLQAGDGVGNLLNDGPLFSPGIIQQDPLDNTSAVGTFDIQAELLGPLAGSTVQPLTVEATFDQFLPAAGTAFTLQGGPISVEDESGAEIAEVTAISVAPFETDTQPIATLQASNVTSAVASHTFTVRYEDDNLGIDVSTLGTGDVLVQGPNGFSQVATFVSVDNNTDGLVRTATYRVNAPGGSFDASENGTYTVTLQAGQVFDVDGNAAAQQSLGTFIVNVAPGDGGPGDGGPGDGDLLDNDCPSDPDVVPRDGTDQNFIRNLYEDLLDRAADQPGLNSWLERLADGDDRDEIIEEFLDSREYLENLVREFYVELLDRPADPGGLDFFTDKLENGDREEDIIAGILASPEYFLNNGSTDTGYVNGLYSDLLGRAPDEAGRAYWVDRLMEDDISREQVAREILDSDELNLLLLNDPNCRFDIMEGWIQDYLQSQISQERGQDFFEDLQDDDNWRDVQLAILDLPRYYNAADTDDDDDD